MKGTPLIKYCRLTLHWSGMLTPFAPLENGGRCGISGFMTDLLTGEREHVFTLESKRFFRRGMDYIPYPHNGRAAPDMR